MAENLEQISINESFTLGARLALVEAVTEAKGKDFDSKEDIIAHVVDSVKKNDVLQAAGTQDVVAQMYEEVLRKPELTQENLEDLIDEVQAPAQNVKNTVDGLATGESSFVDMIALKGDIDKFELAGSKYLGINDLGKHIQNYVATNKDELQELMREPDMGAISKERRDSLEELANLQKMFGGGDGQSQESGIMGLIMTFLSMFLDIEPSNVEADLTPEPKEEPTIDQRHYKSKGTDAASLPEQNSIQLQPMDRALAQASEAGATANYNFDGGSVELPTIAGIQNTGTRQL